MTVKILTDRYRVVKGSQSAHCCFTHTVVDTMYPDMAGERQLVTSDGPQFVSVCECFGEDDARMVCDALNRRDAQQE